MSKFDDMKITTPILLIGFNRPNVIREAFNFIRAAKPAVLYVAIDAARNDVDGELQLVNQVKWVVQNVDWDCKVLYKFNETNLGAEITVSSAVSWVLDFEETVIVLEDDIIAPTSFFYFAQEMLERYKHSDEVFMVSSNQFTPFKMDADYTFSIYGHTNGWATWKRAWNKFDLNTEVLNHYLEILDNAENEFSLAERYFLMKRFEKMGAYGRGKSTWDLCWFYIRFVNSGLTVVPRKNLSSNIGVYGLHATGISETHFRPYDENFYCERYPNKIERNFEYDYHHFKKYLDESPTITYRLIRKLKKIFKIDKLIFNFRRKSYENKKKKTLHV